MHVGSGLDGLEILHGGAVAVTAPHYHVELETDLHVMTHVLSMLSLLLQHAVDP